jgi:tRNA nucleotidyltransferase (CCA-adding enzyme)
MQLLLEARPLIDRLSGDRIRHELDHIMADSKCSSIMSRLQSLDLLIEIHPNLTWDPWLDAQIRRLNDSQPGEQWSQNDVQGIVLFKRQVAYILWLIRLTIGQVRSVIERLKLPLTLRSATLAACDLWSEREQLAVVAPSAFVDRLDHVPWLSRYALYLATDNHILRQRIQRYQLEWQHIVPSINGHDLKKLGVPPGPVYRRILGELRNAWLDGEIQSPEDEQTMLNKLLPRQ